MKSAGTSAGRFAPPEACATATPARRRVNAIDLRSREYAEIRNMFLPPQTIGFEMQVVWIGTMRERQEPERALPAYCKAAEYSESFRRVKPGPRCCVHLCNA